MDERPKGLVLTRDIGQTIIINELIEITITDVVGSNCVRVVVNAPDNIKIDRSDKYQDYIEQKRIPKDLQGRTRAIVRAHSVDSIRGGFGKYSYRKFNSVPTYFLKYVLGQEQLRRDPNQDHINHLISEIENRKNPSEGLNGKSKRTIQ